ncbi:hypothetical protein [Kitasatospora phosalacinea]|uniref:hypothetical protein n=1 Tax=Kitasatospora phosalacinea TaxID=2065 RepID=UPI002557B993|nr:hypothetical protein [Kitasatospora phosalacinea]
MTLWHQSGRTVPGRRDHEWSRLVAPPRFSPHPAPARERLSPPPPPDLRPDGTGTETADPGPADPAPTSLEPTGPAPVETPPVPSAVPSAVPSVVRPREAS